MKKYTLRKPLIRALLVFIGLILFAATTQATVGGPIFIHSFKYNSNDESVYFVRNSLSGRGCPPVLMKMPLNTGEYQTVYSCDQGEKFLMNSNNTNSNHVYNEINAITNGFKDLVPVNLKKNSISIDIDFTKSEKFSPELPEIKNSIFTATIYQDGRKITEMSFSGCNTEQPFTFAGYTIPGFEKKIILLLSTKGDCVEGGYIDESLFVLGGINLVNKEYVNFFKGESALSPNEGTLIVFEKDSLKDSINADSREPIAVENNKLTLLPIAILLSLLVGFIIGRVIKRQ